MSDSDNHSPANQATPSTPSTLEDRIKCRGYFGFGTGWAMAKNPVNNGYCNNCILSNSCWKEHVERARQLYPEQMEVFDELAKTLRGGELVAACIEKFDGPDPLIKGMLSNIEDGMMAAHTGRVHSREMATLPYPFNVIQ